MLLYLERAAQQDSTLWGDSMAVVEMDYEKLRIRRKQVGQCIFEALKENPPNGVLEVHRPDDLGAVGVDYGNGEYILILPEDRSSKQEG